MDSLQFSHNGCFEKDKIISRLIEEVGSSEHLEVRTRNALAAAQRLVKEEEMKTVEGSALLANFPPVDNGIWTDVHSAPDSMGNFIADNLRFLETRVRGATSQSLEGLLEILRDVVSSYPIVHHCSI